MKFQKINSKILSFILLVGLFASISCEADDTEAPGIDGLWEMKKITNPEGELITGELWGSVFWDFDLAEKEVEILIDYLIIMENNEGRENEREAFFFGLPDKTYSLKISSDLSKNEIQIGNATKGSFTHNGNELILNLNYENGEFSATEIYYFEKSKQSVDHLY